MKLQALIERWLNAMHKTFAESGKVAMTVAIFRPDGNGMILVPEPGTKTKKLFDRARLECGRQGAIAAFTVTPFGGTSEEGEMRVTSVQALLESRMGFKMFEWSADEDEAGNPVLNPVCEWAEIDSDALDRVPRFLPYSSAGDGLPETEVNFEDLFDIDFNFEAEDENNENPPS